jgi:hypothetical protein
VERWGEMPLDFSVQQGEMAMKVRGHERAPPYITTRTTHRGALAVRGAGYDVDAV